MTTTDLALPPVPTTGTVSLIQQTALELTAAHQIATAICGTSFVPTHFRGKPDECAVAILYGATVGFDPVTAIQQIFVIGGKPALYARAMVAIVLAQGHEIWTEEEEPGRVVVAGRRKGSERVTKVEWTSALAQQAGYTSNAKYKTDPRSMLYARASGDVARRIAPDALMGMAYNVEELELGTITATQDPQPSERSGTGRLRAAIAPAPAAAESAPVDMTGLPEAPAEDAQDTEVVDAPHVDMITTAQSRKLHALLREAGADNRDAGLAIISGLIEREITTTKDLTKDEASRVIDQFESEKAADAARTDDAWLAGEQPGGAE